MTLLLLRGSLTAVAMAMVSFLTHPSSQLMPTVSFAARFTSGRLHVFTNRCCMEAQRPRVACLRLSVGGAAALCCSSLVIFTRLQQLLPSLPSAPL